MAPKSRNCRDMCQMSRTHGDSCAMKQDCSIVSGRGSNVQGTRVENKRDSMMTTGQSVLPEGQDEEGREKRKRNDATGSCDAIAEEGASKESSGDEVLHAATSGGRGRGGAGRVLSGEMKRCKHQTKAMKLVCLEAWHIKYLR